RSRRSCHARYPYTTLFRSMSELGDLSALEDSPIEELERVYQVASKRAKEDEAFAERARQELSKLQSGDADNLAMWRKFVETTRRSEEHTSELQSREKRVCS